MNDLTLKELVADVEEALIKNVKKLVCIPSVLDENDGHFPFGKGIDDALKETLNLCELLGFNVFCDPEGYYGYAEIGEGDELIGILGHLDVVPPGRLEEWRFHPFEATECDGLLYGRGTQDDKGPTLAALFGVKALMNGNVVFNKRIRFIFGTDEENLWRCMNKYVQLEEIPHLGFTPDSKFPLIYAEKGLLQCVLEGENKTDLKFSGGSAFNAVPDQITYQGEDIYELKKILKHLGFAHTDEKQSVTVLGKSVHAQVAEQGQNAIARLVIALHHLGHSSKVIDFITSLIKEDAHATQIFGHCEDEVSGHLKFNIGKINVDELEQLFIDIRIPVTVEKEYVVQTLTEIASVYGLTYKEHDYLKSIYVPIDSKLVTTLMNVYQEVTKDKVSLPISSGGATYARAFNNCVAFGGVFPNRLKTEHQPNEYVIIEDLKKAMFIYAKAVYRLLQL